MREGHALPDLDLRREAGTLDPDLSVRHVPRGRLDLSEHCRRPICGTPVADLGATSHRNFACFARLSPASTTQGETASDHAITIPAVEEMDSGRARAAEGAGRSR